MFSLVVRVVACAHSLVGRRVQYERPRHGNLGFLPRKRTRKHRGKVRSFPKNNPADKPHLTAFMGYKAGMTHVVRDIERPGSSASRARVAAAAAAGARWALTAGLRDPQEGGG